MPGVASKKSSVEKEKIMRNQFHVRTSVLVASFAIIISLFSTALSQSEDVPSLLKKGRELIAAQRMTEALPIYERLILLDPKNPEVFKNLAFALLGEATVTDDTAYRRELRIRARKSFISARDLGDDSLMVKGLIDGLPADGADAPGFSDNAEANKLMQKAEGYFVTGKMDDAFKTYQEALKLDPQCYHAALFSGDAMMHGNNFAEAEKWYQRAIAINPYIETAYRYSATPLMKQGKYDQARERYVDAYITEPYSKLAISGIVQWAQATQTRLGHPKINIPKTTVGADGKKNVDISISLADDGSIAWIAYSATRETWEKEKFAKTYPKEKTYRHSVAEEADALRSVVTMAKSLKPKSLNPQIALIEKLDKDGLLEAFILIAIADNGIARDHAAHLRSNREKLRQYVLKYVIEQK
jgi:tetratricopeptide (TPR) repeat protein